MRYVEEKQQSKQRSDDEKDGFHRSLEAGALRTGDFVGGGGRGTGDVEAIGVALVGCGGLGWGGSYPFNTRPR